MMYRRFPYKQSFFYVGAIILAAVLIFAQKGSATLERLYPSVCLGGWENTEYAIGEVSVSDRFDTSLFNTENSALLQGVEQIFCSGFSGEIHDNTTITHASLHFSLAVQTKDEVLSKKTFRDLFSFLSRVEAQSASTSGIQGNEQTLDTSSDNGVNNGLDESGTVEEGNQELDTEELTESTTTTSASTSISTQDSDTATDTSQEVSDELIVEVVESEDGETWEESETKLDETNEITEEPGVDTNESVGTSTEDVITEIISSDDDGETWNAVQEGDIAEVFYTLDGTEWFSLGKITETNWTNIEYTLPITSWEDFENLQIKVQGQNPLLTETYLYLDAMWVKVSYEEGEILEQVYEGDFDELETLPIYTVDNSEEFLEPLQQEFEIEDAPEFEFHSDSFNNRYKDFSDEVFEITEIEPEEDGKIMKQIPVNNQSDTQKVSGENETSVSDTGSDESSGEDQGSENVDTKNEPDSAETTEEASPSESSSDSVSFFNTIKDSFVRFSTTPIAYAEEASSSDSEVISGDTDSSAAAENTTEEVTENTTENVTEEVVDESEENSLGTLEDPEEISEITEQPDTNDSEDAAIDTTESEQVENSDTTNTDTNTKTKDKDITDEDEDENETVSRIINTQDPNKEIKVKDGLSPEVKKLVEDSVTGVQIVSLQLRDTEGKVMQEKPVVKQIQGKLHLQVPSQPNKVVPGTYTVDMIVMRNGVLYKMTQDFQWGVLAVNVDKTIYQPGDTAYIQMAALDELGHTRCDATLELKVRTPSNEYHTFSTKNETISYGDECGPDNVTSKPDYFLYFDIQELGEYKMTLTDVDTGYSIDDVFRSERSPLFNVERITATRINPFKSGYVVDVYVTAQEDFKGYITERVPAAFTITDSNGGEVSTEGDTTYIRYEVELAAGSREHFSYTYEAPKISPQFYKLGPITIDYEPRGFMKFFQDDEILFQESRQWQIASDAATVEQMHYRWRNDDGGETAATWNVAEDTATTSVKLGATVRLRVGISNEGDASSSNGRYSLQYSTSSDTGSGTWNYLIPYASSSCTVSAFCIDISNLSLLIESNQTTNVSGGLTDEASTFVAGEVLTTNATTSAITLAADEFTELEWAFKVMGNAATSTTYYFRVVKDGAVIDAYNEVAELRITDSGSYTETTTFRDGLNGYSGTEDTYIWDLNPDTSYGSAVSWVVDINASDERRGLLKFDVSSIPSTATITTAALTLYINTEGQGFYGHRILNTDWSEASTYNSLSSGINADNTEASSTAEISQEGLDTYTGSVTPGTTSAMVETIEGWVSGLFPNYGWLILSQNLDGMQFDDRTVGTAGNRPTLSVGWETVDTTAPQVTDISTHTANGSYGATDVIDIDVTFSEPVTSSGDVTVTLETGTTDQTCTFSVTNAATGTCNYTVQLGDSSADLAVKSISGMISDSAGNSLGPDALPIYNNLDDMHAIAVSAPSVSLEQSSYRFLDNEDNLSPGTDLAADDTPATLDGIGDAFRLKLAIDNVDEQSVATSTGIFKLQYVDKGAGTCASPSGGTPSSYTDVSDVTLISFYDNASLDDGDQISQTMNEPAGTGTAVYQTYEEENNATNTKTFWGGEYALWDFALYDNGAAEDTTYCFRMLYSDGTTFNAYNVYPEITTASSAYKARQGSYRFFENDTSVTAGAPITAENGTTTLTYPDQTFRLRQLVNIASSSLATSTLTLSLEYVDKGAGTCASPSGGTPSSYTTVTNSTSIKLVDTGTPAQNATTTANANDPDDGNTIRYQGIQRNFSNGYNQRAIAQGQDALFDFVLQDNGATPGTEFCFRLVDHSGDFMNSGSELNNGYLQYPEITVAASTTFSQGSFRLFENNESDPREPGAALAVQNASATLASSDTQFKIRQLVNIGSSSLATSTGTFKLQYVDKGAGTCASPSGGSPSSYTDVTGATSIAFYENATSSDGATLTSSVNDPDDGNTVYHQTLEQLNNATNSVSSVPVGQDGLWDFSLVPNGVAGDTTFCFRMVQSDGTEFSSYNYYPEITTSFNTSWWNDNWSNRQLLTFDNSAQTEDLVNFPVLVRITPDTVTYSAFNASGSDMRFLDADQSTVLDFEVEEWVYNGTSTVWVEVPQIDGSSDTDRIYMYYGNPAASTSTENVTGVWNSNYVMVHHFAETSGSYLDSTSNNHDSDAIAVVSRASTTGSIGPSPEFDGGDATDYVTIPDSNDFDMTDYTIEAYVNSDGAGSTVSSGSGGTTVYPAVDKGLGEAEAADKDVQFMFGLNTSNQVAADFEGAGTSANNPVSGSTALTANGSTWYYIANRMNTTSNAYNVFLNGSKNGTTTRTDSPSTGGTMKVAVGAGTKTGGVIDGGFNGKVDEVRISNTPRSDDWIQASSLSIRNQLITYGSEENNASLTNTNVEPASLLPGAVGNVVVSFTTSSAIPSTGKIVITFPTDLAAGFTLGSGGSVGVTGASGIDGSFSVATTSTTVILTRSGGSSSGAGAKSFTLTNIKNPTSTGSTGTYQIKTTNSSNTTIDEDTTVSADTIAAGALSSTNVQPASLNASDAGDVTVSFTTANPIPSDGKIVITFPTDLDGGFTFSSSSITIATSSSGIDGTLTVATSSNVLTVTRSGGSESAAGAKSFVLTNIANPSIGGSTGVYQIKTTDADDVTIDEDTSVSADTIVGNYPLGDELILYRFEGGTATVENTGTGGVTYDSAYSGTAATTSNSQFGDYAATFGETGAYVDTKYGSGLNPTTQSMSFQFWIYKNEASAGCNTGDDDHFFGASGAAANTRMYLRCRGDVWEWRLGGNAAVSSGVSNSHQTYEHIVFVLDADTDTATFYHNGSSQMTSAIPSYTIGRDFWLGNVNDGGAGSEASNATIDDFALWDRALTSEEVETLYNASLAQSPPSNLATTSLNTAIALRWDAPSGTTSDYTIQYKLSASSTWTTFNDGVSTATNTVVTGLTNDVSYDFRVSATNQYGSGNYTSAVSATPGVSVFFITPPTIANTVSTTSTSIFSWASTTFPVASFRFRLENDEGSLIEATTTTDVYGPADITKLTIITDAADLSIDTDSSDLTYASTTDTLFVIHNNDGDIDEITTSGAFIRKITCATCGDTEGIELISSVPDGSGDYIHTFMISTEGVSRFIEVEISSTTTAVDDSNEYLLGFSDQGNFGLEGLAYRRDTDIYYAVKEKTPMAIYEIDVSGATSTTEICDAPTLLSGVVTDIASADYKQDVEDVLYILSHESSLVVAIDVSNTSSCSIIDTFAVPNHPQEEGIEWDERGEYFYVLGEPDYFSKWRTTEYQARYTYSGLSSDEYNMYIGAVDQYGNVSTTTARNFTVSSGSLSVDMVDAGGSSVTTPSISFSSLTLSLSSQTATSTLGTASQKIRVANNTGTAAWTLSIAASSTTALWDGTTDYDFNDPTASANDGGDSDSVGGQLTIDPSGGTITPEGGCTSTGISLGASNAFSEGVTDSITLASATSGAETSCYWDFTDINFSQSIPAEQAAGSYSIDMTLSIIAS